MEYTDMIDDYYEFEKSSSKEKYVRKQILVVDDDPEQLLNIREQLKEFYDVTLLKSGDALFKYLSRKTPDLIFLDYIMPGESGPEILRQMRMVKEYADIPVVFLTGVSGKEAIVSIISELKPQGYIVKPAKKSELFAKVIDVLG